MGSFTTLAIGNIELDWQKNHINNNHSKLFQKNDFKKIKSVCDEDSETENYIYKDGTALVRPLGKIFRRLDLIGYTPKKIKEFYLEDYQNWENYYSEKPPLPFEEFLDLINNFDFDNAKPNFEFIENGYDPGELVAKDVFKPENFLNKSVDISKDEGLFYENLNPYATIRLLAENPKNHSKEIIWSYQDLVDGGWVKKEEVFESLTPQDKILIVTEGSTDTNILKKSMSLLAPDVFDFFHFIDMKDNYPFTGTGNLLNFCKGLSSIQVQNKILVLFDNDLAGVKHHKMAIDLKHPKNMKMSLLPKLKSLERFKTVGTDGESINDINGRAASIECFLDLNYKRNNNDVEPRVRWKSFDEDLKHYQGQLEYKESYTKRFLEWNPENKKYDTGKLEYLINFIISECSILAADSF